MGYKFSIFVVTATILQTSLCVVNIEAPRRGRRNRFEPEPQSDENALGYNVREGEPSTNFDMETFKNQLTSLSPSQIQQLASLLTPAGASGPRQANGDNVDETKDENNENALMNVANNRRPNRRGGRRNGRRRCRRGGDGGYRNRGGRGTGMGYGAGRGGGNGEGYGVGIGYGSGSGSGEGVGIGSGFGAGPGYGANSGMGAGMGRGKGYGAGSGNDSAGYGIGRGSGGAGGNMLGFGAGAGYANQREPYDYDDPPAAPGVSGASGAMIGGGAEISGVKINSFARPASNGIPPRMTSGPGRRRRNALPAQREDQGIPQY